MRVEKNMVHPFTDPCDIKLKVGEKAIQLFTGQHDAEHGKTLC